MNNSDELSELSEDGLEHFDIDVDFLPDCVSSNEDSDIDYVGSQSQNDVDMSILVRCVLTMKTYAHVAPCSSRNYRGVLGGYCSIPLPRSFEALALYGPGSYFVQHVCQKHPRHVH
ncbi:hypothetical protein TNCV_2801251 [Trichonephila clavipes]|nr:hypothetical protein TNCV_2801251 [Trichonephila clavipes]